MEKACYVVATLGGAPAVLTELLWALVMAEGADVLGLEIWTTSGSDRSGEAQWVRFVEAGKWGRLVQALGDQRRRVPGPLTDACDPEAVIARLAGC